MNQSRFVVCGLFVFWMFCWSGISLGEAASLIADAAKVKATSGDVPVASQPGLPQLWLKSEEGKVGGARLQLAKNSKGKAKHRGKHTDNKGKRKNSKTKADKGKIEKVQESKEAKDPNQKRSLGRDESRMRGLDRADEMAGEHGQHGRAKARTNQGRSNTTKQQKEDREE